MFLPTFDVEQCEIGLLAVSACAAGESRGVAPLVDDHVALEQLAEVRRLLALRHAHLHRLAAHRVCSGDKVIYSLTNNISCSVVQLSIDA